MIEEVIPHTQLLSRTMAGWQNAESFLIQRTESYDSQQCTECGTEYPAGSYSCRKNGCTNGYLASTTKPLGHQTDLMFRVTLDPKGHMHQQHLECERLRDKAHVAHREAKQAREECEKAEKALATAGRGARRTQEGLERKGAESETLRTRNRLLEEHLAKLRTAVGDLKFNEIVGPA